MQVTGRVYTGDGRPARDVPLRFHHVGFGGRADLLGEVVTAPDGSYAVSFPVRTPPVNLQVRAATQDARGEVDLSRVVYDAAEVMTLNLVLPTAAPPYPAAASNAR